MKRAIAIALFALAACEGGREIKTYTQAEVYDECNAWCYHRFRCYQDVCREDYPGQTSDFAISVLANDCVANYCDTNAYAKDKVDQQGYFDCVKSHDCREVTTGTCGDTALCTADPTSTPYLPGTHVKAPPPPPK